LRIAVWTGDTRDTRPLADIGCRRSNLAVGAAIVPWGCSIRLELADACSKKLIVLRRKETEGMHICCPM